jgi:hypothetical protein
LLTGDPSAAGWGQVRRERDYDFGSASSTGSQRQSIPHSISLSPGYYLANPPNPFLDQARLAAATPDFKRFFQQVMTATRQMPQAQARSPEQELLIQYMQKKDQLALPTPPQKRRGDSQPGSPTAKQKPSVRQDLVPFHEQQIASAAPEQEHEKKGPRGRPRSTSRPAAASEGVKSKGKLPEAYVEGKKLTSTNYNTWDALEPLELLKQLEQFHNFKRKFDDKNAYKYKDKMMEYAKKHVPLTKYKPTPQDS